MNFGSRTVVSLFDRLGLTLRPWAEAGFDCYAYDLVQPWDHRKDGIWWCHWDANEGPDKIVSRHPHPWMVSGFPPCTDLATSGTAHWVRKEMERPGFQERAMDFVFLISHIGMQTGARWWIENPVGVIPRFWRAADFVFDPCDYGGYLPKHERHPLFPNYIPPQDAYTKRTCIWCSHDFVIPPKRPVLPIRSTAGESPMIAELGGASDRTKEIRSATPRGFARAVFEYNKPYISPEDEHGADGPDANRP